jgi:hypothetical protein
MNYYIFLIALLITACSRPKEEAEIIIIADRIETMEESTGNIEAIAIKNGKIWKLGKRSDVDRWMGDSTEVKDYGSNFIMPGFIEGHGHFSGLGYSLINLNLLHSKSWEEVVEAVRQKVEETPEGTWIIGRGWHQEKWDSIPPDAVFGYPRHHMLSEVSHDHPVMLKHASGHGLLANQLAMEIAGVSKETSSPKGGEILRNRNGEPIGIFEERAMAIIQDAYNEYLKEIPEEVKTEEWFKAVDLAQEHCNKYGITSFQDAGTKFHEADRYFELAENGELSLRLYMMIRHSSEEMKGKLKDYRRIGVGDDFATARAIKSELDGALGAFGAWLLEPYNDKPGFRGQNTTDVEEVEAIGRLAAENDMQLCVHSIGDRANRECLELFKKLYDLYDIKDGRWRIEHSQHLNPNDIPLFGKYGVIPSMQAVHCTSDAPFVVKRLGEERAREGAYAWRSLIDNGAIIANGTDAPVEEVDPLASIYASVSRIPPGWDEPFFPEQSMTRMEALKSYTIWNAYAAFEEDIKGSIKPGKLADLVVLDTDLITCTDEEIKNAKVLATYVGGKRVF